MIDDAERLRRISAWSQASAAILAPARPQQPGRLHQCSIGSGDIEAIIDGLEQIGPELAALAARLDAAGGRPRLRAVEDQDGFSAQYARAREGL
jgi:hypothetical protein